MLDAGGTPRGYGKGEVVTMMSATSQYPGLTGPTRTAGRPVCPLAGLSFTLGLIALRLCWMPGVNCALALAAVGAGVRPEDAAAHPARPARRGSSIGPDR